MLFSMDDISFDDNNNVVEKSIEDFNKAVLHGDVISSSVWKFVYYNDIIRVIDTVEYRDEAGRWYYPIDVIFELEGTSFSFTYYRGLTEYQENEFDDMKAVPVHKVVKTIVVEEWEVIEKDN